MILTETQIQQVIEKAKAAFPNFKHWQYNNEKNEQYFGCLTGLGIIKI